jgi:hypothetical protein
MYQQHHRIYFWRKKKANEILSRICIPNWHRTNMMTNIINSGWKRDTSFSYKRMDEPNLTWTEHDAKEMPFSFCYIFKLIDVIIILNRPNSNKILLVFISVLISSLCWLVKFIISLPSFSLLYSVYPEAFRHNFFAMSVGFSCGCSLQLGLSF